MTGDDQDKPTDDVVRELADRIRAKQHRGEEWEVEFAVGFHALTSKEQEEYTVLMGQRTAHRKERLEMEESYLRGAEALRDLVPAGETLAEALTAGHVTPGQIVVAVRNA